MKPSGCILVIWGLGNPGFFPGFWEHDPYPWNWEFQRCSVKIWEKIHDLNLAVIKYMQRITV
jgi:hypothetical protein